MGSPDLTAIGDQLGCRCRTRAAKPVTWGVALDVSNTTSSHMDDSKLNLSSVKKPCWGFKLIELQIFNDSRMYVLDFDGISKHQQWYMVTITHMHTQSNATRLEMLCTQHVAATVQPL
jgi:hypothetical protein